ncbi:hypothetical protein HHI36_020256 [Cryptolaemus montrouzieri]|uniref:CCAAT/enhancer-binding protein zeta n=1 Tax=Cryptolaemus montrouzieri TaxID=559131 RepID=A0ABD2N9P5_9CUCU
MKVKQKSGNYQRKNNDFEDEIYQETKKWFEEVPDGPKDFPDVNDQQLVNLKQEAKICYDSETANYKIKNSRNNSNKQWMKTMMTKGTVSDKIASHTLAIQDDPIHNLELLKNFLGMVKISKKNECIAVIDTLTDLFLEDLLNPKRKLQAFHQKPLSLLNELSSGNAVSRRKILSAWYFEDQLKELYSTFVDALNTAAHDSVDANKEKAIAAMYKLLAGNSEQEKKLLAFIVNKLGDPSQKVASKAIYCLGQLLRTHSNMQGVVLNEVEKLLFRTNVSTKSQYYGLCFLSQFYLNHEESEIAKRLIEVYFGFFKACVKKGEIDSRMMSALLMGVNRAYPYAKLEMDKISEHMDTIYRVVHIASFSVSLHALNLLYQVSDYANNMSDRFYSALYKKLLDPQVATTTHQAMLLSLVYKALLKDTEINRVKALVKRLLQLCLHLTPSFTCGILFLISQLIGKKNSVHSVIQKQIPLSNLEDDGDDEEVYKDAQIDLDTSIKEEIISDDENDSTQPKETTGLAEDISIDTSVLKEEIEEKPDIKPEVINGTNNNTDTGWYHRKMKVKKEKGSNNTFYNPFTRNPLYAGAEHTAFLELNFLKQHFHPTVSLYATNILNGVIIKYQGDPLKDFTLIRFLDRFVFKNPKKTDEINKGSHPTFGRRKIYQPKGLKSLPVSSYTYIHSTEENIPVDEKFLYLYLNKKFKSRLPENEDEDSDVDSVASDEFEEMLEKMGGAPQDDDIDFMNDIGDNLKKKEKAKKKVDDNSEEEQEEPSDESDEDLEDDESDEEDLGGSDMEEGDEELIQDLDDDEDEDLVFDDESDEENKSLKKSKKQKKVVCSLYLPLPMNLQLYLKMRAVHKENLVDPIHFQIKIKQISNKSIGKRKEIVGWLAMIKRWERREKIILKEKSDQISTNLEIKTRNSKSKLYVSVRSKIKETFLNYKTVVNFFLYIWTVYTYICYK